MIILSILIPTLHKRKGMLTSLLKQLGTHDEVEILTYADDGEVTTGNKRNKLIQASKGLYVVAVDDDDAVTEDYMLDILAAAKHNPDVITFNGWMTTDGINPITFRIGLNYPYTAVNEGNTIVYLRYPNHLCPIKREIAASVPFPNKSFGEDYDWATKLRDMKLLKTEVHIDKPLYHYIYKSVKP